MHNIDVALTNAVTLMYHDSIRLLPEPCRTDSDNDLDPPRPGLSLHVDGGKIPSATHRGLPASVHPYRRARNITKAESISDRLPVKVRIHRDQVDGSPLPLDVSSVGGMLADPERFKVARCLATV